MGSPVGASLGPGAEQGILWLEGRTRTGATCAQRGRDADITAATCFSEDGGDLVFFTWRPPGKRGCSQACAPLSRETLNMDKGAFPPHSFLPTFLRSTSSPQRGDRRPPGGPQQRRAAQREGRSSLGICAPGISPAGVLRVGRRGPGWSAALQMPTQGLCKSWSLRAPGAGAG